MKVASLSPTMQADLAQAVGKNTARKNRDSSKALIDELAVTVTLLKLSATTGSVEDDVCDVRASLSMAPDESLSQASMHAAKALGQPGGG